MTPTLDHWAEEEPPLGKTLEHEIRGDLVAAMAKDIDGDVIVKIRRANQGLCSFCALPSRARICPDFPPIRLCIVCAREEAGS